MEHVYIAFGSSGGTGIETDPYLANTATRFDEIMRDIPEDTHIHIGEGPFPTLGLRHTASAQSDDISAIYGWHVRSKWIITGAGEGVTTIKLDAWPSFVAGGTNSSKWAVIGSLANVKNVVIENLTVDGNWLNLNSPPVGVALNCVACFTNGPITHRNLTITGFYGNVSTSTECFALCCHSATPVDPQELQASWLAVFDHCTVHHGHGDYLVGIASFNGGPSIINGCNIYSLPGNRYTKAIQAIGRDIQITNNVVRDCFFPFYVDTGNIINLLIERNQFISNAPSAIISTSALRAVLINVRAEQDVGGDFDGIYMDVPIRPAGETSPYYRIRLYFHIAGSTNIPDFPRDPDNNISGILVPCLYPAGASRGDLEGVSTFPPYDGAIFSGIETFFEQPGAPTPFVEYSRLFEAAQLSPVVIGSVVDLVTDGTGTLAPPGGTVTTFTASKESNLLTVVSGPLPLKDSIVTVTGGALPVPLGAVAEWLVREVPGSPSTFQLAWTAQIVQLVTQGAGTQTLIRSGAVLGTLSVNTTTNRLTIGATLGTVPADGDIVTVSNSGGALPAPLTATTRYKVKEVSGSTFKLAVADQGEWIRHSAGAPFVSDESKVYIQSGWSWTNWKIRNNYLEVPFLDSGSDLSYSSLISLNGNGSTDKDYHISDNVGRFTGVQAAGKKMYNLLMDGIDRVTLLNNSFDYRSFEKAGEVQIYKAEKPASGGTFPIDVLYRFGNKDLNEQPHPWLPDDLHLWANIGQGESYVHGNASTPKPGLGTTPLTGAHLANDAAAAAGAPQVSPAIRWSGHRWVTDSELDEGGRSQSVSFRAFVSPHAYYSPSNVSSHWELECSIDGGPFARALSVSERGGIEVDTIVANNGAVVGGGLICNSLVVQPPETPATFLTTITLNEVEWRTGAAAPTAALANGSFYSRIDGGAASGVYVRSNDTWVQVINPAAPGPIGGGTPGTGAFTILSANSLTVTGAITTAGILTGIGSGLTSLAAGNLTGEINNISIGVTTAAAGRFTTLTATSAVSLSPSGATVTISPTGALTINPASGTMNNVTVGGTSPAAGTFTTLAATTSLTLGTSGASAVLFGGNNILEQRNSGAAQTSRIYDTFTDASNYRRANFYWSSGDFYIETQAGGSGASGLNHLNLKTAPGKQVRFFGGSSGSQIWSFDGSGHLVAGTGSEMIKWGATPGSSYPALKRSGVELHVRRADDSTGAPLVYPLAIAAKTASYTIAASEGNRCFTNSGATAGVTFTLPDASPGNVGFHCHFIVETAQSFTIQASGSNSIRIGSALSASHGSATTSTAGNALHLVCTQSGMWVALSREGAWTVT